MMADLLIETDRLSITSPPPVLVKDDSLSVHNYTNPRNLQHQFKFRWDTVSEASSSAMLYVHIVLCLCVRDGNVGIIIYIAIYSLLWS